MARIYSTASRVYVDLGDDLRNDCVAKLVNDMGPRIAKCYQLDKSIRKGSYLDPALMETSFDWSAFAAMTKAYWFRRAWVVQEIGLAQSATVFYGEFHFSWLELMHVFWWLCFDGGPLYGAFEMAGWTMHHFWRSFDMSGRNYPTNFEQFDILDLLSNASYAFQATDLRDHLYAFLGHPTFTFQRLNTTAPATRLISPNYAASPEEVFLDFAIQWLKHYGQSYILSCVNHKLHPRAGIDTTSPTTSTHLPSWCPCWDYMPLGGTRFDKNELWRGKTFEAAGSTTFQYKILHDNSLQLQGKRFDTVHRIISTDSNNLCTSCSIPSSDMKNAVHSMYLVSACFSILQSFPEEKHASVVHSFANAASIVWWPEAFTDIEYKPFEGFGECVRSLQQIHNEPNGNPCSFQEALQTVGSFFSTAGLDDADSGDWFVTSSTICCQSRSFFVTSNGLVELGPEILRVGDSCSVIKGANVPYCFNEENGRHVLVGEVYIPGIMRGELVVVEGQQFDIGWTSILVD